MAVRPSTSTATTSASLASANLTTSLNEPPDANSASPPRHDGVVVGREARLQLDVEAQLVEVAVLLGEDDVDDRRRRGEVEAGQVGDRAGGLVGGAAVRRERFAGDDLAGGGGRRAIVVVVVAAAGGEQGRGNDGEDGKEHAERAGASEGLLGIAGQVVPAHRGPERRARSAERVESSVRHPP